MSCSLSYFSGACVIPLDLRHNHWIDFAFATIGIYAVLKIGKKQKNKKIMMLFGYP
jgi:hypothetical protein